MAKRSGTIATGEHKIEEFAEDLGRMLGHARSKAEGWLGQREAIVKTLTQLRDEATKLLNQFGHQAQTIVRRGRKPGRKPGRPAGNSQGIIIVGGKKRRKMSAAARKRISDAQKARWAKQKAAAK
jgi:hypothetical protein